MEVARSATTILLIDAHKADREYWKQHLTISSPDYVVLEAATGAGGLAICESQRIDCVITEFTLPDMSGFEVLAHLVPRASDPEIAVIMLSHITLPPVATFALNTGAQSYLIKSRISGDYLDRAIHEAIAAVGPTCKKT
jgi:DNA-binding NarL/FixJ family response regulator